MNEQIGGTGATTATNSTEVTTSMNSNAMRDSSTNGDTTGSDEENRAMNSAVSENNAFDVVLSSQYDNKREQESGADKSSVPMQSNSSQPASGQGANGQSASASASQATSKVIAQVQEQAMSRLNQQKDHTAGDLTSVAEALRKTGQELREKDAGMVANYASHYSETAAEQVEKVSDFLSEKDVNQLLVEVEDFAQREPAIFIAGAFLLGLAGARFLRVPSSS